MKFTKEEARRRVLNCAKQYQQKLLNKKLIVIYRERKDNAIRYIEVAFYERNYQHLTGIELLDEDGNVLHHQALPVLMDVTKITKITGDYNNVRPYLFVNKVMGGVNFCLGLTRENTEYVPSSALLEDIKKVTDAPSQVLAIFEKDAKREVYETVQHVAKGLNLNHIQLPDEIKNMIDLKNYVYKGKG